MKKVKTQPTYDSIKIPIISKWFIIGFRLLVRHLPDKGLFKIIHKIYDTLSNRIIPKITYSVDWYDNVYHPYVSTSHNFKEYMDSWEKQGYKNRLYEVLAEANLPQEKIAWLEVACMQGKTAYWVMEKYPQVNMYMFDFSPKAIEWIRNQFPPKYKFEAWVGDIRDIRYNQSPLDDYFNVVTCIDVTEHLPKDIYLKAIKELYRVTKPDGLLILMQGNAILPEHINVLSEEKLLEDFCSAGFKFVKPLPHRHHLLKK